MVTSLKLSNVLYRFTEFYNDCKLTLRLETNAQEQLEELHERYLEVVETEVDGTFSPEMNVDLSLEIIEFCLDEFTNFKNIFDYTTEEILNICPGKYIEHYPKIYDYLVDSYDLNAEGDISMFSANLQDVDVDEDMGEPSEDLTMSESLEFNVYEPYEDVVLTEKFNNKDSVSLSWVNLKKLINKDYTESESHTYRPTLDNEGIIIEEKYNNNDSIFISWEDINRLSICFSDYLSGVELDGISDDYVFEPGNVFTIKDEWKDGNEGEYYVIEDRGDRVLASPMVTKMSIVPQEVIRKKMIAEVMVYNKTTSVIKPNVSFSDILNFVDNDNNDFSCETDGDDWDSSETIDFATRENGDVGSEIYGIKDLQEAKRLKKLLEEKFNVTVTIDTVDEWVNFYVKIN